jgi:hypothetical protein
MEKELGGARDFETVKVELRGILEEMLLARA